MLVVHQFIKSSDLGSYYIFVVIVLLRFCASAIFGSTFDPYLIQRWIHIWAKVWAGAAWTRPYGPDRMDQEVWAGPHGPGRMGRVGMVILLLSPSSLFFVSFS